MPFTFILSDPLANSFIYSPHGDATLDAKMKIEKYDRTQEENEDLGLLDMNTDNYDASTEIVSDKLSMANGGKAIDETQYHPNVHAIHKMDQK